MALPAARSGPQPARPARAAQPRLRVVAPPRRTKVLIAAIAWLALAGVFGVVALNAMAAENAFTARTLEAEVRDLAVQYDELTARVAALDAPDRVRAVAVGELGMVPAETPAFLVVDVPARARARSDDIVDPIKPALQPQP